MNARRLAVTETNMAYRTAAHLRWQSLDFVTGIEVRLSNNHNCKGYRKGTFSDICDDLQGRYPKDFKFTGWHPHCRCVAVPILKNPEEVAEDNKRIMQSKEPLPASDSPEAVTKLPKAFTDWTKLNADRIEAARAKETLPYFLKDNEGLLSGGKSVSKNKAKPNTRAKASAKVKKTAELTAAPASLDHLATSLGIKVDKPMTFEQADHKRGNPYRKGTRTDPYSINCQSCVVAYEARLRGLDVAAMPNFKLPGTASTLLARDMTLAWKDPKTGKRPAIRFGTEDMDKGGYRLVGAANFKRSMERLDDATTEKGRYLIVVLWRGRGGHVFSLERKADGSLFSFDPQTGESGVLRQYLRRAVPGFELLRIDTLEFDTDIASRVLIKQSAPRLNGLAAAKKAKGGVLGAPKKGNRAVKEPLSEAVKERRQEIKQLAIQIVDKSVEVEVGGGRRITACLTNGSIKEWVSKPHHHCAAKNELLLKIQEFLKEKKAKFKDTIPDKHDPLRVKAHIFETEVGGDPTWIILREFPDGQTIIHCATDEDPIKAYLAKLKGK